MNKCFCFIDFMPLFVVLVFVFICEQLTEVVPSLFISSALIVVFALPLSGVNVFVSESYVPYSSLAS